MHYQRIEWFVRICLLLKTLQDGPGKNLIDTGIDHHPVGIVLTAGYEKQEKGQKDDRQLFHRRKVYMRI